MVIHGHRTWSSPMACDFDWGVSAQLGFQGNTFLDQAPGEPGHPMLLSAEATCGKPGQTQGELGCVGGVSGEYDLFSFPYAE